MIIKVNIQSYQVDFMVYVLVEEMISKGKLAGLIVLIGDKERINNFIYEGSSTYCD